MVSSRLDQKTIFQQGMAGDLKSWLQVNLDAVGTPEGRDGLAAFPPKELMEVTTGLTEPLHFAQHGVHFVEQLEKASPVPLSKFKSVLDFGSEVGRVARLFKGYNGSYTGVDIHNRNVLWIRENLPHVSMHLRTVRESLPFKDGEFDCVISISVFTNITEYDHRFYIRELNRVTQPGAVLLLSIYGDRALERGLSEENAFDILDCSREQLEDVQKVFSDGPQYCYIPKISESSLDYYEYGKTFINEAYIREKWSDHFKVLKIVKGSLHDFQDVVVLQRT